MSATNQAFPSAARRYFSAMSNPSAWNELFALQFDLFKQFGQFQYSLLSGYGERIAKPAPLAGLPEQTSEVTNLYRELAQQQINGFNAMMQASMGGFGWLMDRRPQAAAIEAVTAAVARIPEAAAPVIHATAEAIETAKLEEMPVEAD